MSQRLKGPAMGGKTRCIKLTCGSLIDANRIAEGKNSMLEAMSMSTLKHFFCYRDAGRPTICKGLANRDDSNRQAMCEAGNRSCDKCDVPGKPSSEQRKDKIWVNKGRQDFQKKPFRYRILVVDDEKHMGRIIADLLSEQGHQCMTANDGIDALNQFKRNGFDAVITDIEMPEMDGIALRTRQ